MSDIKITPDSGNIEIKHGEGELPRPAPPVYDIFGDRIYTPMPIRPGKRREPTPWGYYGPPGTGPVGQTCGTCAHAARIRLSQKAIYKCRRNEAKWSHSRKTDILVRTPACIGWETK